MSNTSGSKQKKPITIKPLDFSTFGNFKSVFPAQKNTSVNSTKKLVSGDRSRTTTGRKLDQKKNVGGPAQKPISAPKKNWSVQEDAKYLPKPVLSKDVLINTILINKGLFKKLNPFTVLSLPPTVAAKYKQLETHHRKVKMAMDKKAPFVRRPQYGDPDFVPFYKQMPIANKKKIDNSLKQFYERKDLLPRLSPFHPNETSNKAYWPLALLNKEACKKKATYKRCYDLSKLAPDLSSTGLPSRPSSGKSTFSVPRSFGQSPERLAIEARLSHAEQAAETVEKAVADQIFNEKNFQNNFVGKVSKESLDRFKKFMDYSEKNAKEIRPLGRKLYEEFLVQTSVRSATPGTESAHLLATSAKFTSKLENLLKKRRTLAGSLRTSRNSDGNSVRDSARIQLYNSLIARYKKKVARVNRKRYGKNLEGLERFIETGAVSPVFNHATMARFKRPLELYGLKDYDSKEYKAILKRRDPRNWKKKKFYNWRKQFRRIVSYQTNYIGFSLPEEYHDHNVLRLNDRRFRLIYPGLLKHYSKPTAYFSSVSGANSPAVGLIPRKPLDKLRRLLKWSQRFASVKNPSKPPFFKVRYIKNSSGSIQRQITITNKLDLQTYTQRFFKLFREALPIRNLPVNLALRDLYRGRHSVSYTTLAMKGATKSGFTFLPEFSVAGLSRFSKVALGLAPAGFRGFLAGFNLYHPFLARNPGKAFGPKAMQALANYQYIRPADMAALSYRSNALRKLAYYFNNLWSTYQSMVVPIRENSNSKVLVSIPGSPFLQKLSLVFFDIFSYLRYSKAIQSFYTALTRRYYLTSEGYLVRHPLLAKFPLVNKVATATADERKNMVFRFIDTVGRSKFPSYFLTKNCSRAELKIISRCGTDLYDEIAVMGGALSPIENKSPYFSDTKPLSPYNSQWSIIEYFFDKLKFKLRRQRLRKANGHPLFDNITPEHCLAVANFDSLNPSNSTIQYISKLELAKRWPISGGYSKVIKYLTRSYAHSDQVTFYLAVLYARKLKQIDCNNRLIATPITNFPTFEQEHQSLMIFKSKLERKLDSQQKAFFPRFYQFFSLLRCPRSLIFRSNRFFKRLRRIFVRKGSIRKLSSTRDTFFYDFPFTKILAWSRLADDKVSYIQFPTVLIYLALLMGRPFYVRVMKVVFSSWAKLYDFKRLADTLTKRLGFVTLASPHSIQALVNLKDFLNQSELIPTVRYILSRITLPRSEHYLKCAARQLSFELARKFRRGLPGPAEFLTEENLKLLHHYDLLYVTNVDNVLFKLKALSLNYRGTEAQVSLLTDLLTQLRSLLLPSEEEKQKLFKEKMAEALRKKRLRFAKFNILPPDRINAYTRMSVKRVETGQITLKNWRMHEYFIALKDEDAKRAEQGLLTLEEEQQWKKVQFDLKKKPDTRPNKFNKKQPTPNQPQVPNLGKDKKHVS